MGAPEGCRTPAGGAAVASCRRMPGDARGPAGLPGEAETVTSEAGASLDRVPIALPAQPSATVEPGAAVSRRAPGWRPRGKGSGGPCRGAAARRPAGGVPEGGTGR